MHEAAFSSAIGDWRQESPHRRFGIYRNNVAAALINALAVRYPVTRQLVGPAFFAAMAGAFAERNRPASPVLIHYGEGFPDFIRGFAPAAGVPYLGDAASFESLWWHAYHAADTAPLAPAMLAAVPADDWGGMRFAFHPSLGLMAADHAVGSIWQAHHGGPPMSSIDTASPERVLVARPQSSVELRLLDQASFDFLRQLQAGSPLADAALATAGNHPDFDLAAQLQGLLALGIITGVHA